MSGFFTTILSYTPKLLLKMQDASGSLADASGNSHTAAMSGAAATYRVSGPDATGCPYGITFANTTVGTIADHADLDLGDGPFTLGLCLKKGASGTDYAPLKKSTGSDGYAVFVNGSTNTMRLNAGAVANIRQTSADTDLGWHYWVFTRGSGADGKVWRDGVDVTTASNTVTFTDNAASFLVGNDLVGSMAALFVVKGTALDSTAVAAIYAARSTSDGGGGSPSDEAPFGGGGGGFFP